MHSVELFAGCGGLALGLARAGFEHDIVIERDSDSVRTLTENKRRNVRHVKHWELLEDDTRDIDFSELDGVDLVSGGPPCQPFSIGGKHLGAKDPRNMWPEAIRVVREVRPKAFVFENVRGLLRPDFKSYLEYIMLQLTYPNLRLRTDETRRDHFSRLKKHAKSPHTRPQYRVLSQAVNAADYGAPQKRSRAIIMGLASQYGDDWTFPKPTHSFEALAWAKHVEGDYWKRHDVRRIASPSSPSEEMILARLLADENKPPEKAWVTVRDAIFDLPRPTQREEVPGHWQHPGARTYDNHTGSCADEPAKALKAGDHGVPGGENMLVNRVGNVRYFTVREMARLQGFPDNFSISGSWKAATRQLGNAVPTALSERIGRHVKKLIKAAS